jgi:hypothetical protein
MKVQKYYTPIKKGFQPLIKSAVFNLIAGIKIFYLLLVKLKLKSCQKQKLR